MTDQSPLDRVQKAHSFGATHICAALASLLIASAGIWAYFAKIDEVAVAEGEVIPAGQVKIIQHLEGGILDAINVAEGQSVSRDQVLARLNLGMNAANKAELQVQIDSQLVKKTRLQAEAAGAKPRFETIARPGIAEIIRAEMQTYESRQNQIDSSLRLLRNQSRQRELAIRELETKLRGREASLKLASQRFRMSGELLKNDLVPKIEHLALENEVEKLKSEIAEYRAALPKAREALAEARERETVEKLNFRRAVLEELGNVERAIARNREILSRASDQASRQEIRSPIDGIVKNLHHNTIGGVVRPGEAIMEIVPVRDKLVIEARLDPIDVGYVRAGQKVVVKLATYDFVRYGGLDGKVALVAPDSSVGKDGQPYFRVVVETEKSHLGETAGSLSITAGMGTVVDIHTGQRTVLSYLVSPVLKLRHEAFRER